MSQHDAGICSDASLLAHASHPHHPQPPADSALQTIVNIAGGNAR